MSTPIPVSTSAEVRALDAYSIDTVGISSMALMELAGRAVCEEIAERFEPQAKSGVLVLAGRGNNGGDGYVIARMLFARGYPVRVCALPGEMTPDCRQNHQAATSIGIPIEHTLEKGTSGLVVDAMVGTGLTSALRAPISDWVGAVNAWGLPVIAVDLPTGVCGDSGALLGTAVRAALTVCIGRAKLGAFLEPAADWVGDVVVADIGLVGEVDYAAEIVDGAWVAERLPKRTASSHKKQHGHLAVVAGSVQQAGAAVLTCNAAMASGCGLVTLMIHPSAVDRLGQLGPEIMVKPTEHVGEEDFANFQAVAVGPGFGTEESHRITLRNLWEKLPIPAVFDADGLTALSGDFRTAAFPRCVTPHPGEAARLLGWSSSEIQANRYVAARRLGAVVPTLLKGRHSLISAGTGPVRINPTGSSALATAGSGDVLTGIVGAYLAGGVEPAEALTLGAFVHGWAAESVGRPHLAAGELNAVIGEAMVTVAQRCDVLRLNPLFGP